MAQELSYEISPAAPGDRIGRKLKRLLAREDLRKNLARGVCRRVMWRLRWQVSQDPWLVRREGGPPLLLPHSGAGAMIYFQGVSEPELSTFLKRYLKPGMVFVDIGAHLGEYTILAADLVGASGKIHAFEACGEIFKVLNRNIELNGFNNVEANPWAVWSEDGHCEFEKLPESSISALRPDQTALLGGEMTQVNTVTLDSYFQSCGGGAPSLIKIDVEGAELHVLNGARSLLTSSQPPDLIVEYGPRNTARFGYPADTVCEFLRELGYTIFQWNGGRGLMQVLGSPILPRTVDSCNLVATRTPCRLE